MIPAICAVAARFASASAFVIGSGAKPFPFGGSLSPVTARQLIKQCTSTSLNFQKEVNMPAPEMQARPYSWHLHAVWRGVEDGGKPGDEDVALSLLREFVTEFITYFKNPDVEAHMKGYTAESKLDKYVVGVGNPLLAMEEVLLLEEKAITSPEGEVIKNRKGPFHWIADKNNPARRIDVGEWAIFIPIEEDETKNRILFDLTTRWWRRRMQETAKERGCDTISLLLHPNSGQLWDDHSSWLLWWDSDHRYQFMPAIRDGVTSFGEARAQFYLKNLGPFIDD